MDCTGAGWDLHRMKYMSQCLCSIVTAVHLFSYTGRDFDELHLEIRRPRPGAGRRAEAAQKATRAPRELL